MNDNVTPIKPPEEFYLALSQGLTAGGVKGALTNIPDDAEVDHIRLDHGCFTVVFRRDIRPKG